MAKREKTSRRGVKYPVSPVKHDAMREGFEPPGEVAAAPVSGIQRYEENRAPSVESAAPDKTATMMSSFFARSEARQDFLVLAGDAYDLLDSLPEESVDLALMSPPYWGLRTYGLPHNWDIASEWKRTGNSVDHQPPYAWYRSHGGVLGLEPTPEWYVQHLVGVLNKLWRPLKRSGSLWLNIGDTYFARWASIRPEGRQGLGSETRFRRKTPMGGFRQEKNLLLIPARVAIGLQDSRWILRNDLIWFKPNVPPRADVDRLRLAHEHFFHFVKRPSEGRAKYYYDKSRTEPGDVDVVTYRVRPGDNGHSATFPSDLIRPRILSSCPPGGVVIDPFCGTGRTLVEALATGRRAIGFDLSVDYAVVARESARTTQLHLPYAQLHQ